MLVEVSLQFVNSGWFDIILFAPSSVKQALKLSVKTRWRRASSKRERLGCGMFDVQAKVSSAGVKRLRRASGVTRQRSSVHWSSVVGVKRLCEVGWSSFLANRSGQAIWLNGLVKRSG